MKQFSVFCIKYLVFGISILILYSHFLVHTSSVYAQTLNFDTYCQEVAADPAPANFQDPEFTEPIWDELDTTPYKTTVTDTFDLIPDPETNRFSGSLTVSNLKLPNAQEVSDYLEGRYFSDSELRLKDLRTLSSQDYLTYYGPLIKLIPRNVQDRLKMQYVYALTVLGKRADGSYKLTDINFTYTDVCGENERTIYDLYQNWQFPWPPNIRPNATSTDFETWRKTWGKYWPKIPIHAPSGTVSCDSFDPFNTGDPQVADCQAEYPEGNYTQPPNMRSQGSLVVSGPAGTQEVRLGIPDLLRLDTLARFTQQLLVPDRLLKLYYCKFRNAEGRPGDFCPANEPPEMQGATVDPVGEPGVGGNPIYIYDSLGQKVDSAVVSLGSTQGLATATIESKFPYLGLTFGKLTSAITGTFKFFDPQGTLKTDKYQKNSTKIPYNWGFSGEGSITEPRVWAGFLSGVKKSKNFVICSLLPSQLGAAGCAAEAGL